ncbi:ABC transporter ATP-binding protein [Enterococcus sp. AZ103]|uniref:ABC transporter ATP-binding protein n=1 Tax=Enterococcus sp. AZ103 TaxID=2774628 RepID=UPI003F27C42B
MIEAIHLTKYYGKTKGIKDLNIKIEPGEIFGFIGPNGAGKTTVIRLLLALIYPTSGTAEITGLDCFKGSKKIKEHLGYVPSEVHYYADLTVNELFEYSNKFYKKDHTDRFTQFAKRLDLNLNKKIHSLSTGNKKKVAIIQALLHEPKVLIFDEPTGGLDPLVQHEFFEILKEEKAKGTTILFSSHILSEVQKIYDRVAFIKDGELFALKKIETLYNQQFRQVELHYKQPIDLSSFDNQPSITNLSQTDQIIRFLYQGNIHHLLSQLAKDTALENLSISEPTLEDVFIHFYQEGRRN